jgi:hypothetical protein
MDMTPSRDPIPDTDPSRLMADTPVPQAPVFAVPEAAPIPPAPTTGGS